MDEFVSGTFEVMYYLWMISFLRLSAKSKCN